MLYNLEELDTPFRWTVKMQIKALMLEYHVAEVPASSTRHISKSKVGGTVRDTTGTMPNILSTIRQYWWRWRTGSGHSRKL